MQPHLTFSEDLSCAFVERTPLTATPTAAIAILDSCLTDPGQTVVPDVVRWTLSGARVVSVEWWDEDAGQRVAAHSDGARELWRIEISDAAEFQDRGEGDDDALFDLLAEIHAHGQIDDHALARARLLHEAVEQEAAERQARQAARPADAPRAYLREGAGALLARLAVHLSELIGMPEDSDGLKQAVQAINDRVQEEDEKAIQQWRAQLADLDNQPG